MGFDVIFYFVFGLGEQVVGYLLCMFFVFVGVDVCVVQVEVLCLVGQQVLYVVYFVFVQFVEGWVVEGCLGSVVGCYGFVVEVLEGLVEVFDQFGVGVGYVGFFVMIGICQVFLGGNVVVLGCFS